MDTGLQIIAYKLANTLATLESKRGELAEVKKAEARAKVNGFVGDTRYEAEHNASLTAIHFTEEVYDLDCDVRNLERWADFYTLLIQCNVIINVDDLPGDR